MKYWLGVEGAWRLEDQGFMSCPTSIAHSRNQGFGGGGGCFLFFAFELENHTFCAIMSPSIPAQAGRPALRAAESSRLGLEWAELSGALDVQVEKPRPCNE